MKIIVCLRKKFDRFPEAEDFILQYEVTIRKILEFLDLDAASVGIPSPRFAQSADDISEEWSQQFRLPITIYGLSLVN